MTPRRIAPEDPALAQVLPLIRTAFAELEAVIDPPSSMHLMTEADVLRLATEGLIEAIDGSTLRLEAQSICVHGDSAGAVDMARRIREELVAGGVAIAPFAGGL